MFMVSPWIHAAKGSCDRIVVIARRTFNSIDLFNSQNLILVLIIVIVQMTTLPSIRYDCWRILVIFFQSGTVPYIVITDI